MSVAKEPTAPSDACLFRRKLGTAGLAAPPVNLERWLGSPCAGRALDTDTDLTDVVS